MSNLGPLAPDHNPFADDHEGSDVEQTSNVGSRDKSQPSDPSRGFSSSDEAGLQQHHWDQQDQHLDALTASLNRQHEMSLQMNEELDLHQELLEEFDGDTNRTGLRLGGAASQMDRLRSSLKDHGMVWVLGGLIVGLILLIAFFK
ncbi:t-SNARE coiled-coil homology domain-containing protein [Pseudozyma hubeiensis]|nr:t-SNARE coiled-coil homology domain-containing protein [Pseudozyma hubeiensis]